MELFSTEFFSALAAIIVIDLVLAGDNAIVIALAARNVPAHLRTRAIVWGAFGAIAVRTVMTLAVVWLLKIPGLLAIGGLLLVWIAWKLLEDDGGDGHEIAAADSFWGAMKTIVIADAVMGLDNVLAVAGAAHGNFLLVVLGLLISIPIVIWGSQLILKFVERFPAIIYIGAGVLVWTAAKMILGEPLFTLTVAAHPWITPVIYTLIIAGVLGGAFVRQRQAVSARIDAVALPPPDDVRMTAAVRGGKPVVQLSGGGEMQRVLLPIDNTRNAIHAARHVASRTVNGEALEVHLLHVRRPLPQHIARLLPGGDRRRHHLAQAERALAPVEAELAKFGIASHRHIVRGEPAWTINAIAAKLCAEQIVIATARKNSLTRWLQDSITNRVLQSAQIPVQVIAGDSVSAFERWALPAGLGTAIALLLMAEE